MYTNIIFKIIKKSNIVIYRPLHTTPKQRMKLLNATNKDTINFYCVFR